MSFNNSTDWFDLQDHELSHGSKSHQSSNFQDRHHQSGLVRYRSASWIVNGIINPFFPIKEKPIVSIEEKSPNITYDFEKLCVLRHKLKAVHILRSTASVYLPERNVSASIGQWTYKLNWLNAIWFSLKNLIFQTRGHESVKFHRRIQFNSTEQCIGSSNFF